MNKRYLGLAGLIAALALVLVLAACGGGGSSPVNVTIIGEDIKFSPTTIEAQVGQTVNLTLDNQGALDHSLYIDEFNVKIEAAPGQKASASFTPNAAGTYEFYCHVAGHTEAGMVGSLIVK